MTANFTRPGPVREAPIAEEPKTPDTIEVPVDEWARLLAIEAAAQAWCDTYAVRPLTPEESALMLAVATRGERAD